MTKYINLHKNDTLNCGSYQLKFPLNIKYLIPTNDLVHFLSKFVEEMNLSDLYSTYSRLRENKAMPRQMLKIVLYSYMNRCYSSSKMKNFLQFKYFKTVIDSGYESEENYIFIKNNRQLAFIKILNYEI